MNKRSGLIRLAIAWTVIWNAGWIAIWLWAGEKAQSAAVSQREFTKAVAQNNWIEKGVVAQAEFDQSRAEAADYIERWRGIEEAARGWGLGVYGLSVVLAIAAIWIVAGFRKPA